MSWYKDRLYLWSGYDLGKKSRIEYTEIYDTGE